MIQRKTQNLAYWREQFKLDESDHEYLYEKLAEATEPQRVLDLALAVIERRCRLEESRIRNELNRGLVFDPSERYKVGDDIVFPAFDFRLASVLAVRSGQNPEHGVFDVITVRFEDNGKVHDFASGLTTAHVLNRHGQAVLFGEENLLSSKEILEEVAGPVQARMIEHLQAHPDYFVHAGPLWMTADQMVAVSVGHLNIAEAAIEMSGKPLATTDLLEQVEIDPTAPEAMRRFSLETALQEDERFAQVGRRSAPMWYLRRIMPPPATTVPALLVVRPTPYDRSALDVGLLQAEWEINDEWADGGFVEDGATMAPSTTVALSYPHLAAGTLSLPNAARALLPRGDGFATQVTLVDGRWGNRFSGWVVHEGRYVAGLEKWYIEHKLPVGARIVISRTNNPHEVMIDFKPQRMRREWIRSVRVEDGRIAFQMQRHQIACDYDDQLLLGIENPEQVAEVAAQMKYRDWSVAQLVGRLMPELTKLSPQGTAHVKALYSAVNVLRRTPPGPIFAALARVEGATDTGSGFWSL